MMNDGGQSSTLNGTSLSSAIMAGLIACLNGNSAFALKTDFEFKL